MAKATPPDPASSESLIAKYGAQYFDRPPAIARSRLLEKVTMRDRLDQSFAAAHLRVMHEMHERTILDETTRYLVLLGQFTITKSLGHLEDCLVAAIGAGVSPRQALEPILLATVYGGEVAVEPALRVFERVAEELGVIDLLQESQMPIEAHDETRDLDAERELWPEEVFRDPRLEEITERHGLLGTSIGLRYRGSHHLDILELFNGLDQQFTDTWLFFGYQRMYSRWVMDDRTRMLSTLGDCLAVHEFVQAREHMKGALSSGATPGELKEIIFLTAWYFGFPVLQSLSILIGLLSELGRLSEVGDPEHLGSLDTENAFSNRKPRDHGPA